MLDQDKYLLKNLKNNGFAVIASVLTTEEVLELRNSVQQFFRTYGVRASRGLTQPNAAVEIPEISWIFHHPRILSALRWALDQEKIIFTSHCDVHMCTLSSWHKDDGIQIIPGGYFGYPAYGLSDHQVYKVAIYLQDHSNNKTGLTVRRSSHQLASYEQGEEIYLPVSPGDIIIFDVRLTHIGQRWLIPPESTSAKMLNLLKRISRKILGINPKTFDDFVKRISDRLTEDRMSIFFTYGAPNDYTRQFAINNMKRQLMQSPSTNVLLSSSLRKALAQNNVLTLEDDFTKLLQTEFAQDIVYIHK